MLIDAHQHFWQLGARRGYWPPATLTAIYRDFAPADLLPLLAENHVRGTVLVQTLPTEEDTGFMLELAAKHDFILGVVGWADLEHPDAPERIARLAGNSRLKGLRPMLQDIADPKWIDRPTLTPAVRAMVAHGLVFDALVLPAHLDPLIRFATRHPDLTIIIDHAAKPLIAQQRMQPWLEDMQRLASLPHVHCKLSGLLTEAGEHPTLEAIAPYASAVLDLFGPQRVLWGSDWPVLRLAGDYSGWLDMVRQLIAPLSPSEQAAILGENAIRLYRLAVDPSVADS